MLKPIATTADPLSMIQLGILLAFGCAIASNVAFLCKHRGAVAVPPVRFGQPLQSARALFANRWWSLGWGLSVLAFALHVGAMAIAPLSLVQAVVAGSLVSLAIPATLWFGIQLGRREWTGLGLSALGLALLAVTTDAGTGVHSSYSISGMALFQGAAIGIGAILLLSGVREGSTRISSGALLAIASGLLIGVSNVAVKALTGTAASDLLSLVSPWSALAISCGIVAFFGLARALQSGGAIQVIALSSVSANIAAIIGGITVFGDPLGTDALAIAGRTLAFAAVIVAAALVPGPSREPVPAPLPA